MNGEIKNHLVLDAFGGVARGLITSLTAGNFDLVIRMTLPSSRRGVDMVRQVSTEDLSVNCTKPLP